jgi:hypothetical protein
MALTAAIVATLSVEQASARTSGLDGDGIPNSVDTDVYGDGISNGEDRNVDGVVC